MKNYNLKVFFLLASSFLLNSASSAESAEVKKLDPLELQYAESDSKIVFKLKEGGLITSRVKFEEKKVSVNFKVNFNNEDYLLIPAKYGFGYKPTTWGYERYYQSPLVDNCSYLWKYFLLAKLNTGNIIETILIVREESAACPKGNIIVTYFSNPSVIESSSVINFKKVYQNKAEYDNELSLIKQKEEKETKDKQIKLELAAKNKLITGARVCKVIDGFYSVGFTENYSKENGKIQVRVSESRRWAFNGPEREEFKEFIIWDNHNSWQLCELN